MRYRGSAIEDLAISNSEQLHENIHFLSNVAETGRRGSVFGGAFIVAAGIVYGVATFIQWAMSSGALAAPSWLCIICGGSPRRCSP